MDIVPIPKLKNNAVCLIPPRLPQGSCLFVAPTGGGKGTLILNLLLRAKFGYLTHYQHIFILSPTLSLDDNWRYLKEPDYVPYKVKCADGKRRMSATVHFNEEPSWDDVQAILSAQQQLDAEERTKVLIVIDDLASDMTQKAATPLRRLAMR